MDINRLLRSETTPEPNLYLCELVDDHLIRERFYRKGISAEAVREGLELFEYGPGAWRVSIPEYEEV